MSAKKIVPCKLPPAKKLSLRRRIASVRQFRNGAKKQRPALPNFPQNSKRPAKI